ncbi:MAG: acetyltransferase [Cellvibrio sp. 79]|nr:MAG: acetyltransferase [Cellvibrio sp. 79]
MKKLAIIGASGHGKVVADIAETCGWEAINFFDDANGTKGTKNGAWPITGNVSDFILSSDTYTAVIVAIGNNEIRSKICDDLLARNIPLATLIHPTATISRYAQIGPGSVVVAGSVINTYASIGRGAIINTNSSIDHDCSLGNYVHISPGANLAGNVCIGDKSWIGIGACVKQQIIIGNKVIVGAGSVVVKNVPDNMTVTGIPARPFQ